MEQAFSLLCVVRALPPLIAVAMHVTLLLLHSFGVTRLEWSQSPFLFRRDCDAHPNRYLAKYRALTCLVEWEY